MCGDLDFLYPSYKVFEKFAKEKGYDDIVFEEESGYGHEWRFWDKYIEKIISRYISNEARSLSF